MPPPSTPPAADSPLLFERERGHLLDLLASLAPADWGRPTPCPGWTVLDLAAHLLGDDLGVLARLRDDHHGTAPPDGATEHQFVAWLDALQVEWVQAARRLSPRLVADLLAWSGPQVVELFRAQDPRDRSALVSWAGPDPVPVWLDHVRELSEHWIHRRQILDALGRSDDDDLDLDAGIVVPVLDGLRWAYPYRLGAVAASPGDTVVIEVTGPAATTWILVAGTAGWDFAPTAGGPVVASLRLGTDEAWRLLSNNLPQAAYERLTTDGDPAVLAVLLATRAIIGLPG